MKFKIIKRRLNFLHHVFHLDGNDLAIEVLEEERRLEISDLWSESLEDMKVLDISVHDLKTLNKYQWKQKTKEAVKAENRRQLLEDMKKYTKIQYSDLQNDDCVMKDYFKQFFLKDARTKFAIDCKMLVSVKSHFSSDKGFSDELWECEAGCGRVDSVRHITVCPGYEDLRTNRDLDNSLDQVHYFQDVIELRMGVDKY